jgi:hypothetical protein
MSTDDGNVKRDESFNLHNARNTNYLSLSPLASLSSNTLTNDQYAETRRLPSSFTPGPLDVICARGKKALQHSGNQRLRVIREMNVERYSAASSKIEKSLIVSSIVDSIREASPNGGFVKEINGVWYEVGSKIAREKCGQG